MTVGIGDGSNVESSVGFLVGLKVASNGATVVSGEGFPVGAPV